jgi:hypothetical protein
MLSRKLGSGVCELCEKTIATRKVKFKAQYLESASAGLLEEESMNQVDVEKRVCEKCLDSLKNAKNITDLTFERL